MKMTVLQIVQKTLNDMDSEDVTSISDTLEAMQIASIVEDVYYSHIASQDFPVHKELVKLTALADSNYPTHFEYPTDVKGVEKVYYNVSTTSTPSYREIYFMEPLEFLSFTDNQAEDYVEVADKNGGTTLFISNDRMPTYYTSFDEKYIIFDSYLSTTESTLQQSKTRCYAQKLPTFSVTDSHIPDLEESHFPLLLAEVKSQAFSLFKSNVDPKIEQKARRLRAYLQNDKHKTTRGNRLNDYGR